MALHVARSELRTIQLRTRMPFRYGIATMTDVPLAFLRVWVHLDGKESQGIASDCLPPKWFTKVPEKALDVEIQEMLEVISHAQQIAERLKAPNLFELWRTLCEVQLGWGRSKNFPPLLSNFGTSLIERAVIDAICRATGEPFFELLRAGVFGIAPGEVYPALADVALDKLFPARPLERVIARHTVGLADPISDDDIPDNERLNDGLPQSLQAAIRFYGLRHFKIKVAGNGAQDIQRLRKIARVLGENAPPDFAFSLDGNEQFISLGEFREFWARATADDELTGFFDRLLFVEQPLHRSVALDPGLRDDFEKWRDAPPIIIDESDGAVGDAATALDLGYAGASHKNCKGVIKGIVNFALISQRRVQSKQRLLMTGEDLCITGPVALQQDLAVMAALGISSVERNGHHYHAGLSQFPVDVQNRALAGHPDLYDLSLAGWPRLRITKGEISVQSINAAPFGSMFAPTDAALLC